MSDPKLIDVAASSLRARLEQRYKYALREETDEDLALGVQAALEAMCEGEAFDAMVDRALVGWFDKYWFLDMPPHRLDPMRVKMREGLRAALLGTSLLGDGE